MDARISTSLHQLRYRQREVEEKNSRLEALNAFVISLWCWAGRTDVISLMPLKNGRKPQDLNVNIYMHTSVGNCSYTDIIVFMGEASGLPCLAFDVEAMFLEMMRKEEKRQREVEEWPPDTFRV